MTKVDFYTGSPDKLRSACQLSQKAMQNGLKTVISLPDAASCDALDKLLWVYPDTGFIPHCLSDAQQAAQTPVLLSYSGSTFPHHDLLISLCAEALPFFSRFDRLIEIIGTDEEDSRLGRERYKFYRDRGYELRHFDLSREQRK
ncbi:MAG: DNA polymerase III subunit chi [Gallionellales bacterium CG03_land_8_20_14_0_80_55_15]|nr:MAG: DNA polymerase III subunit chi [Gallionellales bacterium CG03_land_8_20_14_0_80_55_15]